MNDHMPVCPNCCDLNDPGAERCESCNARLYVSKMTPPRRLAVVQTEARESEDPLRQWWRDQYTAAELRELSGWVA